MVVEVLLLVVVQEGLAVLEVLVALLALVVLVVLGVLVMRWWC